MRHQLGTESSETRAGVVYRIVLSGRKGKGLALSSLMRKVVSTARAPGATGPYSQTVLVNRAIYISGQRGVDTSRGQLVPGDGRRAKQAPTNMGEILEAVGWDFTNVVKTAVLLADINDFGIVNETYKQYRKSNFPARAACQVAAWPKGGRVEIEAVAAQGLLTTASL
ncbi:2-iminobutanoate/2-iminopropanoate deaminase-like [Rhinolophus ferrumequinum]|uniref:2-iminobutanoate/2-iminopropanoate deaminase-like n=1 Tax=Rhinolophus ferrumequinum TaxID=59479 RepID=UPI00140F5A43|nr:2-iminobutanoate/2-iminopropanoate deaminase-like [Rhinolophus ferrumequinum]